MLLLVLSALNASNYIFHVVISRMLGPEQCGALAALLAVVMAVSVPFGVIQTVVAKRSAILRAEGLEDGQALAVATAKGLMPYAATLAVVLLLGSPLVATALNVDAASASLPVPYLFLGLLGAVPLGALQGELRFPALAGSLLAGTVLRLAIGIGLVVAGLGVFGAMLATALPQRATLWVALRLVRMRSWGEWDAEPAP